MIHFLFLWQFLFFGFRAVRAWVRVFGISIDAALAEGHGYGNGWDLGICIFRNSTLVVLYYNLWTIACMDTG
jgi:hypothetical protein